MNGKSLLQYSLIVCMNSFLFLGVVFYPVILAVLHILIYYLSFSWLVDQKQFRSNWSAAAFVMVPDIVQTVVCIVLFYEEGTAVGFLPMFTAIVSIIELVVLAVIYRRYRKRQLGLQGAV